MTLPWPTFEPEDLKTNTFMAELRMADHSSINASPSTAATSSASSCNVCAKRNESRTSDAIGSSASPFKDVMRSAESGCPVCNSILEGVRLWGVTERPNYADGEIQWMNTARSVPGPLHVKVKSNPEDRGSDSFSVDLIMYTHCDQYDDRSIFGSARSVPRNSSSDETFGLVQEWLDTCIRNHPLCNKPRHIEKAARLVDIGQDPGNTAIKLIAFPSTDVSYVALSYCWGSSLPLKTEKSSLEARMNGISWSNLPKTFQDATTIARKLGYRYLWIDSLCIVQDDQQDWERESAKMGNIFESAAVTLSAAFGADSNAGCFHDRHHWSPTTVQRGCIFDRPTLLGEDRVSFIHQVSDDLSQTVYVERCPEHECLDHSLRFSSAELSPIFNRAWTMQERLLSPRVLQFTRTELCWECHTLVDCECGYVDKHIWLRRQDLGRDYLKVFSQAESPDISHLSLDDVGRPILRGRTEPSRYYGTSDWMDIVREYNQRKLTKATDKLPAFSAIAKRMMRPQYGAYCAGLWEAHLPVALLWNQLSHHNGRDTKLPRKVLPYRAPSWSWASVNGDVIFIGGNMISAQGEIYVDSLVKEVSCPPMGLDPTGQVSGGHILLEAPIVRFRWKSAGDSYQPWNSSSWKVSVGIDGADNGVAWADFHHDISKQSVVDLEGTDAVLFASERTCCELRELEIPEELVLIVISSFYRASADNSDTESRKLEKARGLQGLLVKESSAKPGSYERVGYYLPEYNRCEVGSLAQIAEIRLI